MERQQGTSESVRDYTKALLQRMQESNITDERFMMATYLKGLKASIRAKVLLMNPQTMQEAQHAAETAEQTLAFEEVDDKVKSAISAIATLINVIYDMLNCYTPCNSIQPSLFEPKNG